MNVNINSTSFDLDKAQMDTFEVVHDHPIPTERKLLLYL